MEVLKTSLETQVLFFFSTHRAWHWAHKPSTSEEESSALHFSFLHTNAIFVEQATQEPPMSRVSGQGLLHVGQTDSMPRPPTTLVPA